MDEQGEQPDNVRPLMQTHKCASCGATVEHAQRFELSAHTPECRQPEIRMRRAEAIIESFGVRLLGIEEKVREFGRLLEAYPKETHGNSEASPDTQRSAGSIVGTNVCSACYFGLHAGHTAHSCCSHAYSSAAEPASPSE